MRGVGVHRRTLAIRKERIESANGVSRPDREPRPVVTLAYPWLETNPRLCSRFFGAAWIGSSSAPSGPAIVESGFRLTINTLITNNLFPLAVAARSGA